jgi:type IV pilus assembly protein PilA
MHKFMKAFHRGEKGFTLIELLVVIAILAAIAGVVVLNIGNFIGRGHNEAACTELHNVQTAVIAYMTENAGTVPTLAQAGVYMLTSPTGAYTIGSNGVVTQTAYDGGTACTP